MRNLENSICPYSTPVEFFGSRADKKIHCRYRVREGHMRDLENSICPYSTPSGVFWEQGGQKNPLPL